MDTGRTSDKVFNEIKDKIISGEWTKGTKIMSEPQLVKELGVSRVSVREAIEKMVALSILSKRQGEGTFVNELSAPVYLNSLLPMITLDITDYLDILEFRLMIEVESARFCAIRCDDSIIIELEECYHEMINFKDDMDKFTAKDLDFHIKIAQGSGNPLVVKVYEILRDLLSYHQKSLYKSLGPLGGIREHKQILDALKNRDSELTAIFIRRHIERTIRDLKSLNND
ncbi:GntR family transcriptional regulator [Clostridium polyendosporum]|uniref:GntR family transcriptional regulator n=1 Tax=Clostridium polyendosporum TaxID=69208 RepID=A0A919VGP7_9CLOT|nr:FadR/GntR family transcriptional regulator [Clostridium polyendosporum]GIM29402.1 GntR family transcriptional regulator [Clostridium polyendosporum]